MTSVTVRWNTPINIGSDVFSNRSNAILYVPQGSKAAYQAANYWKDFKEIVEYSTTSTYSLSITSSVGGSVTYSGNIIIGTTQNYTVDEGTNATLTFTPNIGNRLKSVVVNGTDVTSSVVGNQYTISNISQNTTVVVTFEEEPTSILPEAGNAVDLGLPSGILWADRNVGATSATASGDYFAWGDTQTRASYESSDYIYMSTNGEYQDIGGLICGDNDYDAARQQWGGAWRLPTTVEMQELIDKCTWTYTMRNGVGGYEVRGPNGNSIFLPETGYQRGRTKVTSQTFYWSGVVNYEREGSASVLRLGADAEIDMTRVYRYIGLCIRPVQGSITTYFTLSLSSSGGGTVSYLENAITGATKDFVIFEGEDASLTITPDTGYRLKSVVVNGVDVTPDVVDNQYKVSNVSRKTTVFVTFEKEVDLGDAVINLLAEDSYTYTGEAICPACRVTVGGEELVAGSDYTIGYSNNVNAGEATITATGKGRCIGTATTTFTVSKAPLTVKAGTYTKKQGEMMPEFMLTYDGFKNYETESVLTKLPVVSCSATKESAPGEYPITVSGAEARNYEISYVDGKLIVIDADAVVIIAKSYTRAYGNANPVFEYEVNGAALEGTPEISCEASASSPVGTYDIVVRQGSVKNYNVTYVKGTLTIEKAMLIVVADAKTKAYGEDVPELTQTIAGFANGENASVLSTVPGVTTDCTKESAVGEYVISVSGGKDENYDFIYVPATLTVTPRSIADVTLTMDKEVPYTGKPVLPALIVKLGSVTLVEGTDYIVTATNNIEPGEAQLTIEGQGNYTGKVNTTFVVYQENTPPENTYTLTIASAGNGYVSYLEASTSFSKMTKVFTVTEGASATLSFTPNSNGYRLQSVVVNGMDVTTSVVNNQYTISNISQNTTVNVTFEEIPPTTYTLTITSTGGGVVTYSGHTITEATQSYTVIEGTSHTLTIVPNNDYRLKSVVVNGADVTTSVANNQYTISNINQNITVVAEFEEELKAMTVGDVNYTVASYDEKTVKVAAGNYGRGLTVPASFEYDGQTWTVAGIENGALANETDLAAVIWDPIAAFTAEVQNPNLLLYVRSANYAPSSINNVIVNNVAQSIILTEAGSDNDFHCPQAFTAKSITYSHSYQMTTGIDKCQGWETIALPFDVQTIWHGTKGVIVPFAAKTNNSQKAFWLYELTSSGWKAATAIKANTPYIISMPNNDLYYDNARLNGRIRFAATDVRVPVTNANSVTYQGRTFTANFEHQQKSRSLFTLNVNNEWYSNTSGDEGSQFVAAQRDASPFEAYMTTTNNARTSFGIFEDTSTDIRGIEELIDAKRVNVYNLNGQKRKTAGDESIDELKRRLPAGVYIMNGQKVIVR